MSSRGVPFWLDRVPRSRRPSYPRLRGQLDTRVVIVGGGLTGAASAWSFAAAGISCVLIDADRIGGAATAASPGLMRDDFDTSFQQAAKTHGLRTARAMWQGMHRASLDFAAALRRLNARADLAPCDVMRVAARTPESSKALRREYDARRAAGLDVRWLTPAAVARSAAIESGGAIRTRGFSFDPYRACLALAARAEERGAAIYEHSPVKRVRTDRKSVTVTTEAGAIVRAEFVVIATGAPLQDLRALRRHLRPRQAYAVVTEPLPAAVRRELGSRDAAQQDDRDRLLVWMKDDRVLFTGAEQDPAPPRAADTLLVQWGSELMYELSTIYPPISGTRAEAAWSVPLERTTDGLPYIGLHRNFPRHLFALGHANHGAGLAWLAARLFLRHVQGTPLKTDEAFAFTRVL
jgi:glycine/D-amino acid oxidase-like deaminating enzyme